MLLVALGIAVWSTIEPLPSSEDMRKHFLTEQPTAEVQSIDLAEGDGQHIYWIVSFKRPPATQIMQKEYGFRADGHGGYTMFHQSAESAAP